MPNGWPTLTSPEIPLHVFQVLEEEYISLHGPISADGLTVELPDEENENKWRTVEARLDWRFHQGHIKDPVRFANSLLQHKKPQQPPPIPSPLQNIQSPEWIKIELERYLLQKIDNATLQRLCDWQQSGGNPLSVPAELTKPLEQELNELLNDRELYHRDRFADERLSNASKRLIHLRTSLKSFQGDALAQLNRLLLEDTFPESLEKIHNVRLAAMCQRFHTVKQKALSLSGGGIRSGTFALGLLQGLARHDLLSRFDYLSTVSGGGYIGSWLTAWIHRQPKGLGGVTNELANSAPVSKIDPDPQPVHYLREYSSFLTPKVGLLTADTWTFLGIYLRNLLLNWLVFVPLIIAVLTVPRLVVTMTLAQPQQPEQKSLPVSLFGLQKDFYGRHIFLAIGFVLGVWALAYVSFNRPGIREMLKKRSRFWGGRADQRSFLLYCLLPLIISAACLTTYWAWSSESLETTPWWKFLFFGVLFTFLGWLVASLILRRVFNYRNWKDINLYELGALLVAGVVGGILLWLMSGLHSVWENPVVGYANLEKTGQPFPWTYWSTGPEWTWPTWTTELYACFAVPVFMLVFLAGAILFVGLSSVSPRIDDEDREWWSRFGAWVLIAIIAWCVSNTLVIFGPIALLSAPKLLASLGGLSGLLAILLGRSSKTPATETPANEQEKSKVGLLSALMSRSLPLLALVFIASLVAALSLFTTGIIQVLALLANKKLPRMLDNWLTNVPDPGFSKYVEYIHSAVAAPDAFTGAKIVHMNVLHHTSTWFVLGLGLVMFVFGMGLARFINLNLFSLHAGYRNRLIRAFLGASRPGNERNPNPFTGFDPADDIHMHELRPALFDESDFIDPVRLARELQDDTQPLSRYLSENNLLQNLNAIPIISTPSSRLTASLRNDLNGALESSSLYKQDISQPFLQARRIAEIRNAIENEHGTNFLREESLRSDYHLLLNRLILEEAYPNALRPCQYPPPPYKLLHVVNTTLNLVGGHNLAWQQRKAEPFSVTPLHSGCFRLGYRNSRVYGGGDTGGISIGTAAAISGAAASSNMGYYTTSPVISLLLTFFNVRLGWWLGNPGPAGDETYDRRAPKYSVAPIISEAFGLTDDQNKYVYLTDGGHFENLAIYEMVLRRCHIIVVSDGAQDEDYRFTDLGNAVRKIRIDLGVPIEFTSVPIYAESPPPEKGKGMYWAIGKIRYTCIDRGPNVQDGVLLYIKPAVYGDEPRDILEYKKSYPAFPHQSTADQFFDEPQFESYRMLGSHIMDQLCGEGTNKLDLYTVIAKAVDQLTDDTGGTTDPELKDWLREWLRKRI